MTVVTFKTKTEVFGFLNECRKRGMGASAVAMPKELKIGCGLAVQIFSGHAHQALLLINQGYFPTFNGIYSIKKQAGKSSLTRIY